jgi:hypothetical protein
MPLRSVTKISIQPSPPKKKASKPKAAKPKSGTAAKGKTKLVPTAVAGARGAVGETIAPLSAQEAFNWCWAACAQMVAASRKINLQPSSQPEIVQKVRSSAFGSHLQSSPPDGSHTLSAIGIHELYKSGLIAGVPIQCTRLVSAQGQGMPCQQNDLNKQLLEKDAPVQIGVRFSQGGGHVVMVVGVQSDESGDTTYIVHDPSPVNEGSIRILRYNNLLTANGIAPGYSGQWVETFGGFSL